MGVTAWSGRTLYGVIMLALLDGPGGLLESKYVEIDVPDGTTGFLLGARWAALPAWYWASDNSSVILSSVLFFRTRQGTSSVHATSQVGPVDPTRARAVRATVGARTPPSMRRGMHAALAVRQR